MAQKYEIRTQAERFIHNDLSVCAWGMQQTMHKKLSSGQTEGVYYDMMGSLVFSAFTLEAKLNFLGFKLFDEAWPDTAKTTEKIGLVDHHLGFASDWGHRPRQTFKKLVSLRNTLAHGKPEIVDSTTINDVQPEIWDALRSQWENTIIPDFVDRCIEDVDMYWKNALEAAGIPVDQTLTRGEHCLKALIEPPE